MKIVLPSVIFLFLFSLCNVGPTDGRSLEEIRKTKEIRVCISPIHPSVSSAQPEGCREDCQFAGPAYESAMAFASYLGSDIAPRVWRVGWDEQFFGKNGATERESGDTPELLASGACDFYPNNLAKNEWRLKKMDFITLFPNRRMVVVSRAARGRFNSMGDLAGKTAAVEKDTS